MILLKQVFILCFFIFQLLMINFKKKGKKFDQNHYDSLFNNIENNLRELRFWRCICK